MSKLESVLPELNEKKIIVVVVDSNTIYGKAWYSRAHLYVIVPQPLSLRTLGF